jgi:surfeit locus 1 family protein
MKRTARNRLLIGVSVVLAALFSLLGLWQLDRHRGARAEAESRRSQILAPPVELGGDALPPPADLLWRRVVLQGRLDHDATVVLRGRGLQGTPGIHVVTPLVRDAGPDVLVVRGWMPAADGMRAPLSRAVPAGSPDEVTIRGLALPGADSAGDLRRTMVDDRCRLVVARLAPAVLADSLDRELAPFYVRRLTDRAFEDPSAPGHVGWGGRPPSETDDSLPVALGTPEIGSGPHLSYAIQWFAFAAIALVGTTAYLLTRGREE